MDQNFEKYLALYCAPVLMGIKSANLFCCPVNSNITREEIVTSFQQEFNGAGKYMVTLLETDCRTVFFLYDREQLEKSITKECNACFLGQIGYEYSASTEQKLLFLKEKMKSIESFPHEIGIFLDYPLEDVTGFIQNNGKNYKYSGYWKVYQNVQKTCELFRNYTICRNKLYDKLKGGMNIKQAI